jgi:Family of unknown function (DUF6092)
LNETRKRNDSLFELATYLIGSARDCLEEPLIYGPLRMIIGVEKMIEIGKQDPSLHDDFLESMRDAISKETLAVMSDREAFAKVLDDLLLEFSDEMKRRMLEKQKV